MADGPVLFDVGVVALAHAGTPVSEPALDHVRRAIAGDIDAVVPHATVLGAHHVLRRVYRFSNEEATELLRTFRDARRIHWYPDVTEAVLRDGLDVAASANVQAWDGYYAAVARSEGVERILTLDSDFEGIDGVTSEVVLDPEQFEQLGAFIESL